MLDKTEKNIFEVSMEALENPKLSVEEITLSQEQVESFLKVIINQVTIWSQNEVYLKWIKATSDKLGLSKDELEIKIYRTLQDAGYYFSYELLSYISIKDDLHEREIDNINVFVEWIKKYTENYIENHAQEHLKYICDAEIFLRIEKILKMYEKQEWYPGTLMLIETNVRMSKLKIKKDAYSTGSAEEIRKKFGKNEIVQSISYKKVNFFFTAYYQGLEHLGDSEVKNRQYKATWESNDCGRHHIMHGDTNFKEYNKDLFMQHFSYFLLLLNFEVNEIVNKDEEKL